MKFISKPKKVAGNVLIAVIVITSVIGTTLAAYLTMVNTQFRLTAFSQNWNALMPTVEAGLEESLAHLNSIGVGTNRAIAGWTTTNVSGTNFFYKQRTLGDHRYEVFISDEKSPEIRSLAYGSASTTMNQVGRAVRVTTLRHSGQWLGMVAKGSIALGPGSVMDSFNADDPLLSTNGKYDPAKKNDKGFVGSVNGDVTSNGADIYGTVGTGPLGTVTGPDVGDKAWIAGSSGIQPGHYENDLNLSFPDVQPPFASASPATGGSFTNVTYTYSTNSITTNVFPTPAPTNGVSTNLINNVTIAYPSPVPAGLTTNALSYTTATWPGATNLPITTNTTAITGAAAPPVTGTYVPPLNTVINTVTEKIKGVTTTTTTVSYSFNQIVDYSYNTTSYTYITTNFTYDLTTRISTNTTVDNYAYILGDGNYMNTDIRLTGQGRILVTGQAVWYVPGDFELGGQSILTVEMGGNLQLYVGGNVAFAGNGWINNTSDAYALQLWGLPTCGAVKIAGNGAITGTMYAPQATLKGAGGGNDSLDFQGAGIFNLVDYSGHFSFHYDERLGDDEKIVKYRLASWNEY